MKRFLATLFVSASISTMSAQEVLVGDMNGDGKLTISDVTNLAETITGKKSAKTLNVISIDNKKIAGTWTSKSSTITFEENGTTKYANGTKYKYLPSEGMVLIYNFYGKAINVFNVLSITDDYMVISKSGDSDYEFYHKGNVYINTPLQDIVTVSEGITFSINNSDSAFPWVNNSGTLHPTNTGVNSSDSYIAMQVSCEEDFVVSFDWEVSSENFYDYLYYSVDGGSKTKYSGKQNLQHKLIQLKAGTHTIAFGYYKDSNMGENEDIGWISNITIKKVSQIGDYNGHDYVDLGLASGTKWATMNVGANKVTDSGNYYAWGETSSKTNYSWSTYIVTSTGNCGTSNDPMKEYVYPNSKTIAETQYDVAHTKWGGTWRMPTSAEFTELRNSCYWEWTTNYKGTSISGYIVYKVKSNADRGLYSFDQPSLSATYSTADTHIFLPASGLYSNGTINSNNTYGYYWSSTSGANNAEYAYYFAFNNKHIGWGEFGRYFGRTIRPISE